MSDKFHQNWNNLINNNESIYKIKIYNTIDNFEEKHLTEFDVFVFPCKSSQLIKIKFHSGGLYKITLPKKHKIKTLMRKPNKKLLVFDCNFNSIFLLNHVPFNLKSIFLKKINRLVLFKSKKLKSSIIYDKSQFKLINYKDKLNERQGLIMELIEKSFCKLINFEKLIELIYQFNNGNKISLDMIERINEISKEYNKEIIKTTEVSELDEDKSNSDFLKFVVIPCYQLKILYKLDLSLPIELPNYIYTLKYIKKNAKSIDLNRVDTNFECIKCNLKCPFCIIFGIKYNICNYCHLESVNILSKKDNRQRIIEFENKLRNIGVTEIDIFKLRLANSY